MAHSNPILVETIAEQLLAELETYLRLMGELRAGAWPASLAMALADQADRVHVCAQVLPRVGIPLAEFLITRTDLARRLLGAPHNREEELIVRHAEHLDAAGALWRAARRMLQLARGMRGAAPVAH